MPESRLNLSRMNDMKNKILNLITEIAVGMFLVFCSGLDSKPKGVLICLIGMAAWMYSMT